MHGLVSGDDSMSQIVSVLDISVGGLALEMSHWDGEKRLTLGLLWQGERTFLPINVVGTQETTQGTLVHGKFAPLDIRQTTVVEAILQDCATSFQRWQQYLTLRLDDPLTG